MIDDISICKLNVIKLVVPIALLIYAIHFQHMFERNICRALIMVAGENRRMENL